MRTAFLFIPMLFWAIALFAQPVQIIRGRVTDRSSQAPIPFAALTPDSKAAASVITDSNGNFVIENITVGRHDLLVTCTGFEAALISPVLVSSAKETFLSIALWPSATQLQEVVIKPALNKEQPLNNTATVSGKMLSVEEAQRYAGGFDDPARLVAAFAGVSGNTGNNAIIVRGNSPQALQWKMEGIEIPGPNHLGDMRSFGGGSVTALSTQVLANSDFFTGAMPAEYNNALSGVFDIFMREGNNRQHEHTVQVGVVGIDLASEGPFKGNSKSSYLFNYRYSTLALVAPLLAENAGGIKYQDLSFKLHFPTQKAGEFSIWGITLADRLSADAKRDLNRWVYDDDRENHKVKLYMGAAGISHKLLLNHKQYLKSTLAVTTNGIYYPIQRLDSSLNSAAKNTLDTRYRNIVLSSFVHTKLHPKHSNKTGFTFTQMHYDLHLQHAPLLDGTLQDIVKENGNSTLISAYTHSTLKLGSKTTLNAGISTQLFTLNNKYAIEPRAGIKYRLSPRQSLALAYGLHSRAERLNYYFIRNSSGEVVNKKLGFTKAHHGVLSYDLSTSAYTHLKAEAYYQYIFAAPVVAGSSFSLLNRQNDWFFSSPLQNSGKGRNYGLDVTFEKYLSNGYYYMATASVFDAWYRGGDGVWRHSRYNRNYAFNFLIGKEWTSGKNKQNILGVNTRISYQGGDHYTPVNLALSRANQSVVFEENEAFSLQYPAAFTSHLTVSYKMNRKKAAHQVALKILNLTQHKEQVGFLYNYQTKNVDEDRELVVIPNLSYRIDF